MNRNACVPTHRMVTFVHPLNLEDGLPGTRVGLPRKSCEISIRHLKEV